MAGRSARSKHRCREAFSRVHQNCNKNGLSGYRHKNSAHFIALRGLVNCAVVGWVTPGNGGAR